MSRLGKENVSCAVVLIRCRLYHRFYKVKRKRHLILNNGEVGAAIPAPGEGTTGLGAGDGLLVVPTESALAAYGN
jgi:hypothetical protein